MSTVDMGGVSEGDLGTYLVDESDMESSLASIVGGSTSTASPDGNGIHLAMAISEQTRLSDIPMDLLQWIVLRLIETVARKSPEGMSNSLV
jgi:hypothetical protein